MSEYTLILQDGNTVAMIKGDSLNVVSDTGDRLIKEKGQVVAVITGDCTVFKNEVNNNE